MKTPLTYGAYTAIASALLTLGLFFSGYHSDPAKMQSVQWVGSLLGFAIPIVGIVMGMRARRAEYPAHQPFTYARALGAGILVALFAGLFAASFHLLYITVINPDFMVVTKELQVQAMEKQGLSSDQIDQAMKMTGMFMHPAVQFIFSILFLSIFGTIVSLIAAIFVKRPPLAPPAAPATV